MKKLSDLASLFRLRAGRRLSLMTLAAMAAAATLPALVPATASAATSKIALVIPGPNSYFSPWPTAIADAAKTYGFDGIFAVPPVAAFNLTAQNALLDSLAARGYKAFGVFPGDSHGTNAEEGKLARRGIATININGCTYDPSPALFCISTNVYTAAYYQAQQMIKAIGGKGDVALLTSQLTDPNTQLRIQAMKKAVAETNGQVKLVQIVANIDTPQLAPPAIDALLAARGSTLAGAMSTSYYPSIAMAVALTDNPQFRHIKFIGADFAPQVMTAVSKGYLYGTLFQNTYGMAYAASYALYRVTHDGCTVRSDASFSTSPQTKRLLEAGVQLVTKDNVAEFPGPASLPDDTKRLISDLNAKILKCPHG